MVIAVVYKQSVIPVDHSGEIAGWSIFTAIFGVIGLICIVAGGPRKVEIANRKDEELDKLYKERAVFAKNEEDRWIEQDMIPGSIAHAEKYKEILAGRAMWIAEGERQGSDPDILYVRALSVRNKAKEDEEKRKEQQKEEKRARLEAEQQEARLKDPVYMAERAKVEKHNVRATSIVVLLVLVAIVFLFLHLAKKDQAWLNERVRAEFAEKKRAKEEAEIAEAMDRAEQEKLEIKRQLKIEEMEARQRIKERQLEIEEIEARKRELETRQAELVAVAVARQKEIEALKAGGTVFNREEIKLSSDSGITTIPKESELHVLEKLSETKMQVRYKFNAYRYIDFKVEIDAVKSTQNTK